VAEAWWARHDKWWRPPPLLATPLVLAFVMVTTFWLFFPPITRPGADKVVIIDPAEAAPYRLVDLPTRRVHFVVDSLRPKFAYIFTEDGFLRQLDVVKGELVNAVKVTEPYSMDGEWSLPRPRIAVAGDRIAVTDPLKGVVHMVDVASFTVTSDIPVVGAPYNIVAVGGSGSQH
jgi:hypothetical protein